MSAAGPLNLGGADLRGFEAVDPGRYNAEIAEMSMDAVKNADGRGKMPAGTPMMKVRFRLLSDATGNEEGVNNRNVFSQYVLPPAEYDEKKAAVMKGAIAKLFIALGDPEEKVLSNDFSPDFEDYVGKPCVVVVGREPKKMRDGTVIDGEYNNPVKGVKPAGSIGGTLEAGVL